MTRFSTGAIVAAAALAACSISENKEDNGARTIDIRADVGGLKAEVDTRRGGNVSIDGDDATVEVGNGAIRAQVRTDENRSISVATNQQ